MITLGNCTVPKQAQMVWSMNFNDNYYFYILENNTSQKIYNEN